MDGAGISAFSAGGLPYSANSTRFYNEPNTIPLTLTITDGTSADGDFDGDDDVDGDDFLIWQRGDSPTPLSAGDFADWRANFGTASSAPAAGAVPEPSAGLLALACGLALATLRTRGS
jgi:hypothetical protein